MPVLWECVGHGDTSWWTGGRFNGNRAVDEEPWGTEMERTHVSG